VKTDAAMAEILKREGVQYLFGYPRNALLDAAAEKGIRTIIVRQERTGLHMADAVSRLTRGKSMGAFCMQHGPGAENAYGGVAQAFADSIPILVVPQGYARKNMYLPYNFNSTLQMRGISKHCEPVLIGAEWESTRLNMIQIFTDAFKKTSPHIFAAEPFIAVTVVNVIIAVGAITVISRASISIVT